jgi:hypothetical protein
MVVIMKINIADCRTAESIFEEMRRIPNGVFRSGMYKSLREVWCTASLIKATTENKDWLIYTNPEQSSHVDNALVDSITGKVLHKIQVVEIAPKDDRAIELFAPFLGNGYGALQEQTFILLKEFIERKEAKYNSADKAELNLLIYFNTPQDGHWFISLDRELDFDFPKIAQETQKSEFGSIILLLEDDVIFLKNHHLI